jgi:hypothetical protein
MGLEDPEISKVDRIFTCTLMKLDLRERPTAWEVLRDEWLRH